VAGYLGYPRAFHRHSAVRWSTKISMGCCIYGVIHLSGCGRRKKAARLKYHRESNRCFVMRQQRSGNELMFQAELWMGPLRQQRHL